MQWCSVLYLPKSAYKDRPLPYLIGSKEWQENRHIGLMDVDEQKADMHEDDDEMRESNEYSSDIKEESDADNEDSFRYDGNFVYL